MELLKFHEQMESNGCYARMVSVEHLPDLKEDIERLRAEGLIDQEIYRETLQGMRYEVPPELPEARSLIVVARPQPTLAVYFRRNGREFPLNVPPTYFDAAEMDAYVISILEKVSRPETYKYVKAYLPLKTLAARSGLVSYGRNNITYLPKVGSSFRLTAFFSDFPCAEDQWQDRAVLPGCETCTACLQACPTGAITAGRFVIRAGRCLTNLNEKETNVPFPDWLKPAAHNALVGCLRCQRVCPYDKNVSAWMEARGEFSEEETAYLLRGEFSGEKAAAMDEKLKKVGLDLTVFPRNLQALLAAKD
jgi:epoxyqueuosine reductase